MYHFLRAAPRLGTVVGRQSLQSNGLQAPLVLGLFHHTTSTRRRHAPHFCLGERVTLALVAAGAVTAATATIGPFARTERLPHDNSKAGAAASHDWKGVVHALSEAQRKHPSGREIHAVRRALPSTTVPSSTTSPATPDISKGYAHSVEFPLSRTADAHGVLATLTAGLAGSSGAHVRIDDSGTRRRTVVWRPQEFEVSVVVPRVPSFDGRVAIEVIKSSENPIFSDTELDAIVAAYRISQDSSDHVRLLDGKGSVDIGPPTRIDRHTPAARERHRRYSSSAPFLPSRPPHPAVNPRVTNDDDYDGDIDDDDDFDDSQEYVQISKDSEAVRKRARKKLTELGVDVIEKRDGLSWDSLAGYSDVKQRIEETLTLPLKHPDVYDRIVQGTRARVEPNVLKAVLYEGPPGCGKTMSARILASSIGVPFVHVRVETLLSKYYGETTRKLAEVLEAANSLGRCIVFLDECDSVGLRRSGSGGNDVHEVTRRTLSVLLRFIDGMDGAKDAIILAATNHKEDLDAALLSRFDVVVSFPLPDFETRVAVLKLYAKQLPEEDICQLAKITWGFSGRELLDVCEEAERMRAGAIVRSRENCNDPKSKHLGEEGLPEMHEYAEAVERKADHVVGRWNEKFRQFHNLHQLQNDPQHASVASES